MENLTISLNKKRVRVTAKDKNNKLSISSKDSNKVVSNKVKKYAATAIANELIKLI